MVYNPQTNSTPTPSTRTLDSDSRMPNVEDISNLIKSFRAGSATKIKIFVSSQESLQR